MYDELVRCLRGHSQKMGCANNCICEDADKRGFGTCSEELTKLAADAIEELTAYVRRIEELRKDGYYLQKTKMMTYGQATMTMPLPEPPKEG